MARTTWGVRPDVMYVSVKSTVYCRNPARVTLTECAHHRASPQIEHVSKIERLLVSCLPISHDRYHYKARAEHAYIHERVDSVPVGAAPTYCTVSRR